MRLALRPARESDLELLAHRETLGSDSPFDDFGFQGAGAMRRRFAEDGFLPEGGERGRLVVEVDGEVAGTVSWHPVLYGPNAGSRALNIGIVLVPTSRGRGIGSEALRALARYLFSHLTVMRIEGSTDVENLPMQRACERAGFKRDGVLRGAQFRGGRHHDMVMYSLLRTDVE